MEFKGRVVSTGEVVTGTGKNGEWRKLDVIVETLGTQYPKKVALECWSEQADQMAGVMPGTEMTVAFNIESREYNGRWYTSVRPWKLTIEGCTTSVPAGEGTPYTASAGQPHTSAPVTGTIPLGTDVIDDLPF